MQIYGILLNIRGKCVENSGKQWKIIPFLSFSFLNLLPDDPFSRSFPVVFAVIPGENQRISEKNGEYRGNLSVFFPFLSTSLHFHSSTPRFSSPNVKSYLTIRFFVVNIWIIRKFVVSLHCLKEIMI